MNFGNDFIESVLQNWTKHDQKNLKWPSDLSEMTLKYFQGDYKNGKIYDTMYQYRNP